MENQQFEKDVEIQSIVKQSDDFKSSAVAIQVADEGSQKEAVDCLGLAKNIVKTIDERRKYYTDPLGKIVKAINQSAKNIKQPFEDSMDYIKKEMVSYQYKVEELKRKADEQARKKIEKAVENNKPIPVTKTVDVETNIKTEDTSLHFRDNWKAEVSDFKSFVEFCVKENMLNLLKVNDSALNQYAKVVKNSRAVPGCRVFNDRTPVTRG